MLKYCSRFSNSMIKPILVVIVGLSFILSSGCQKKQEQPQTQQNNTATTTDTTKMADTTKKAETAQPQTSKTTSAPDLMGTWTGKFDQRATTLKITEQTGDQFKGKITINYREVINQQVSGTFNPETKKITMKDLLHSRFQGRYSGQLSDDMKKLSGTFTMDLDKSKFNFNLSKK